MSSRIKNSTGRQPRSLLRYYDSKKGSYPSVSKTPLQTPEFKSYDDLRTLLYTSQEASYPTVLPTNRISSSQTEITSTIEATLTITKGVGDQFLPEDPETTILPFNESYLPEQSQTGTFFLTGTAPIDSVLGFSGKLSSKTRIGFEFNVGSTFVMNANTASIVYFNKSSETFNLAGGVDSVTQPNGPLARGNVGRDAKLFGPFGIPFMSGNCGINAASPFHDDIASEERLEQALFYQQPESVTLNSNFAATANQLIPLSKSLGAPFLLESAVIEIPISSSDGWFNDLTRTASHTLNSDAGGPCVTVSLLNQLADDRREIILSATIVPSGDTGSFAVQPGSSQPMPAGFGSFSTPNFVVGATGEIKATLNIKPTVSNGIILIGSGTETLRESRIGEVSPFARSLDPNNPSGRSLFGKEFTIGTLTTSSIKYQEDIFGGVGHGNIYFYENHEISPYLLFPSDNLILAVSKHRPILSDAISRLTTTGSHEFGLAEGTIKVMLYGSQIKNSKEFHDTLDQNLTSNAIHEFLHFDNPVIDQFDIESKISFSGTYIDEFITGTMEASVFSAADGFLDGRRGRRLSIVGADIQNNGLNNSGSFYDIVPQDTNKVKSISIKPPGFLRGAQLMSSNERYFDTLIPRPDQIITTNNGDIVKGNLGGIDAAYFPVGRITAIDSSFSDFQFDESWDFLFPFEPKYSGITRTTTAFRNTTAFVDSNGSATVFQSDRTSVFRPESAGNAGIGSDPETPETYFFLLDFIRQTANPSFQARAPSSDLVTRTLFGIGDGGWGEPIHRILDTPASHEVIIRGFKYGLKNTTAIKTKAIFRYNRYGQFRDMLEQRKDTKIYNEDIGAPTSAPIRVRFISNGQIIPGELTFSNNLSTEATSSLPYFDGEGRSRGALPDTDIVP